MNNRYHKYNTCGQLNTVVLGSFYTADYFNFIEDARVRTPLQTIATEINEDLDYFAQVLTTHGCRVLRPPLPTPDTFISHYKQHKSFMPGPLQPRNYYTVVENVLYQINQSPPEIQSCLTDYNNNIVDLSLINYEFFYQSTAQARSCYNVYNNKWYRRAKYAELAGPDWPTFYEYVQGQQSNVQHIAEEIKSFESALEYETKEFLPLQGPNIFPTALGLVIDCNEYCDYETWFREYSNYQGPVIRINTGAGHTDGCFVVLGNQTILGIDALLDYTTLFPGYSVVGVSDNNYMDYIKKDITVKNQPGSRWWLDAINLTDQFINFVDTYMQEWTGCAYETVFDVNALAINETTVCITGTNSAIIKQLNNQGIECITIPWRHRFFVDCGLHCLTLDLDRDSF